MIYFSVFFLYYSSAVSLFYQDKEVYESARAEYQRSRTKIRGALVVFISTLLVTHLVLAEPITRAYIYVINTWIDLRIKRRMRRLKKIQGRLMESNDPDAMLLAEEMKAIIEQTEKFYGHG